MDTILVIDDDDAFRASLKIYLSELNCRVIDTDDGHEGLKIIESLHPDLVITDLRMENMDGMTVLRKAKELDNTIPIILITGYDDISTTIEAMQLQAYDSMKKPLEIDRFLALAKKALETRKLTERIAVSLSECKSVYNLEKSLIGKTQSMYDIIKKIGVVSMNHVSVIIQGESGTGKELIAKIIHYSGITKDHPFVAVNCSALTETLLESELFGHVKGAFTGAIRDKKGKFELAGDGTIFLDEISEISPSIQVKLLRVLQEKEFERVGGETSIPLKARVVAATNRDLYELVRSGHFREDLFYRLNVFRIDIPPLRERKEDIPLLSVHFLSKINRELHKQVCKIPYDSMEKLMNYEWVGNVRELENTLLQAVVLSKSDVLEKENILIRNNTAEKSSGFCDEMISLDEVMKKHIKYVLDGVKWEKQKACRVLGITEPTLRSKIRSYNLARNKAV